MYNRSLLLCQAASMSFYVVSLMTTIASKPFAESLLSQAISTVVAYYCGQYVASPAFVSPPHHKDLLDGY